MRERDLSSRFEILRRESVGACVLQWIFLDVHSHDSAGRQTWSWVSTSPGPSIFRRAPSAPPFYCCAMRKKVDSRIRTLIENGVKLHHRTLFVIVGDAGREQVVNLHYMLSKAVVKARPSVLWCYKKELGFTSHRKKRMRQSRRNVSPLWAKAVLMPD